MLNLCTFAEERKKPLK